MINSIAPSIVSRYKRGFKHTVTLPYRPFSRIIIQTARRQASQDK